jgi:hypothetical protein
MAEEKGRGLSLPSEKTIREERWASAESDRSPSTSTIEGTCMKCPTCGTEMEEGYLTVVLHYSFHSIKWSQTPEHHMIGGEIIYDPKEDRKLGTGIIPLGPARASVFSAYRCRGCSYVLFQYPYQGPQPSKPWSD